MSQDHLRQAILNVPLKQGRRVIAIAGPPASGKSTLAESLQALIEGACVLPMDGFHLSNEVLRTQGLLARKGAPETFDVAGFETVVRDVRVQGRVSFPTFDRTRDCVVPDGGMVKPAHHTVLVEGNYLLLNRAPWQRLHALWDFSIMLDICAAQLEARLVQRWLAHGFDAAASLARAQQNDLPNGVLVHEHSVRADLVMTPDGAFVPQEPARP